MPDFDSNSDTDKLTFGNVYASRKYERTYKVSDRFKNISYSKSKSAAAEPVTAAVTSSSTFSDSILTRGQLFQCADTFTNDGIVRQAINKHIDFILGQRTKFVIELNEELTESLTTEELIPLQEMLSSAEVKELRRKLIRVNKRVQFHDRLIKLLQSTFVFGRSANQIIRFPKQEEWQQFGEPRALIPINPTRITNTKIDKQTGEFLGFYYNYGIENKTHSLLPASELIPAFIDDGNIYDNSLYSGISPLWPLINVALCNQIINDEDLPESAKQFWGKFGFVYSGTSSQGVTDRIKNQLKTGTFLIHNQEKLKAEVYDLARDIRELAEVRKQNNIMMLQAIGLPLFFMFEDVPNFATASATLQAYKVGTLTRMRTWLRGLLEKYWYDPLLADHLNVKVEDVISEKLKIVATFDDVLFETYKERVDALAVLNGMGAYDEIDVLEALGADKVIERKKQLLDIENTMIAQEQKERERQIQQEQTQEQEPEELMPMR